MTTKSKLQDLDILGNDWDEGDDCPQHPGSAHKKIYTFGSSWAAEADVIVFKGCKCAVSVLHNPAGGHASAAYCTSYNTACGRAKLHVMIWKDKLR